MVPFSQGFKFQSVEKALSRNPKHTLKDVAENLGVGYSTLQRWIRLAKKITGSYMVRPVLQEKIHSWHKEILLPYIRPWGEVLNDLWP